MGKAPMFGFNPSPRDYAILVRKHPSQVRTLPRLYTRAPLLIRLMFYLYFSYI